MSIFSKLKNLRSPLGGGSLSMQLLNRGTRKAAPVSAPVAVQESQDQMPDPYYQEQMRQMWMQPPTQQSQSMGYGMPSNYQSPQMIRQMSWQNPNQTQNQQYQPQNQPNAIDVQMYRDMGQNAPQNIPQSPWAGRPMPYRGRFNWGNKQW